MAMIADWVSEEMQTADLGDTRRDERLKRILTDLAMQPVVSIPAAVNGGRAETEAVYRFFENDAFEFGDILTPHCEATLRRIRAEKVVVIAQDTSEIDLTRPQQQVFGAGPLDEGSRRGCFLHAQHAFTTEALALGSVAALTWARADEPRTKANQAQRRKDRKAAPIEDKESQRWVDGMRWAHHIARQAPDTQIISVSDSEADIFEMLVAAQFPETDPDLLESVTTNSPRAQWIVRACQERALLPDSTTDQPSAVNHPADTQLLKTLSDQVASAAVLRTYEVQVRGRDPKVSCETRGRRQARESRTAVVELRACAVTLRAPRRKDRQLPNVTLNVVLVREVNPPQGEPPIEWLLLTSLPINTSEEALRVVTLYALRWQIEIFFRVLKQGCRLEARRFETLDRVWRYMAVAMVIAWRTLYVMRLGREFPDLSCEVVFEVSEWKAVYQIIHRQPPPKTPPPLGEIVRMVGQLGGFVNRSKDAMPGAETIWKGLQRLHDMALCWDAFGPTNSG